MLDKLTRRIVDSFHKSAKETITPMKKAANNHMNIGATLLKLGTVVLIFAGVIKSTKHEDKPRPNDIPSTIIINNYISEKEDQH